MSGGSSQGGWRDRAGQAPSQGDNKKGWETRNSGYSNSGWGNNQGGAGNKQGGGWGEPRNRGGRSGRSGRGDDLRLIFTQASLEKCGVPPSETMRRAGEVEALNKSESIQEFIELATNVNGQYMHCTLGRFANAFDEEIINMMPDFVFPPSRECRLKLKMPRVFGNPGDRKVFLDIEFPSEVDEYIKELEKKVECFRKSSIEPHIMIAKEKYDEEHYKNVLECIEEWKKKEEEGKGKGEGEAILVIQELRVEMASNQSPNEVIFFFFFFFFFLFFHGFMILLFFSPFFLLFLFNIFL